MKTPLWIKLTAGTLVALTFTALILAQGWAVSAIWNELAPAFGSAVQFTPLQGALFLVGLELVRKPLFGNPKPAEKVTNNTLPIELIDLRGPESKWPPQFKTKGDGTPAKPLPPRIEEILKRAREKAAENVKKKTGTSQN
jgi:hypothetical protein